MNDTILSKATAIASQVKDAQKKEITQRTPLQSSGRKPKPNKIEAFSKRISRKKEKRKRRTTISTGTDEDPLKIRHEELAICFVCGRRDSSDFIGDIITWLSCSNEPVCKAWAHEICTGGIGSVCNICKTGHWREELIPSTETNLLEIKE